ncbi:MAG: prepilin-type N-terminal cleavage/methylation domain-containing protein [Deltaproteobacteria bacterium]|nr:prepilin-type N-terminal cleavage/methylation domain-containing protein [Deltaproteobacteria bacterium]
MSARTVQSRGQRGFTLLEVMVAMAILAIALVALSEINAGAIAMHSYAKQLNVAAMLARGKMLDIETQLDEKGLPAEGENMSPSDGNFEDEGFPQYKWKVEVVAPKADNLDPTKLVSMILGGSGGPDDPNNPGGSSNGMPDPGAAGSGLANMLGNLTGLGGSSGTSASGAPGLSSAIGGMAGGMGGMLGGAMAGPAQMMISQITQMVREVRLTITWMDGKNPQEFTVVEQIVSMGQPTNQAPQNSSTQSNPQQNVLDQ